MVDTSAAANVLDILDVVYAAALDASIWPFALKKIADGFGDVGAVLLWLREDGGIGTIVSPGLAAANADYEANWQTRDLRAERTFKYLYVARTDAVTDRHIASSEEIETHVIYTDFLARHGLGWFAAVNIMPHPSISVLLSVQRSGAKAPYSDAELDVLTRLGRHAESALRLGNRIAEADALSAGLSNVLSRLDCGIFILDHAGRVVFRNDAGEKLDCDPVPLRAALKKLHRRGAGAPRGLEKEPHSYPPFVAPPSSPVLIERAGRRPMALYPIAVPDIADDLSKAIFHEARTIVLALDTGERPAPDPSLLRDLFGLTLSEARVAALVGTGKPPRKVAETLGLAEDTIRKTLQSVFSKTDTNRQSELTYLLSRHSLR